MSNNRVQPRIIVKFLSPDGLLSGGLILPISTRKEKEIDHTQWDKSKTIRRFKWYLSRGHYQGAEAAVRAAIRLECFHDILRPMSTGYLPNQKAARVLLCLWNNLGLGSIPSALKEDLPLFSDAIRYFISPYNGPSLTLYRGQNRVLHDQGVYGIAWTSQLHTAQIFSNSRNGSGVVLKIEATPDMIIAYLPDHVSTPKTNLASKNDFEAEYIIDPRMLNGRVLEWKS